LLNGPSSSRSLWPALGVEGFLLTSDPGRAGVVKVLCVQ
jgi:hypothetical protein